MTDETKTTWTCSQCKATNPANVDECLECGFKFQPVFPIAQPKKIGHFLRGRLAVIGGLLILAAILRPNFFEPSTRSPVSRAMADMRFLAFAIDAYQVDANQFPGAARGNIGINSFLPEDDPAQGIWTFRRHGFGEAMTLTTPVSFIAQYPSDPFFSKTRGTHFGYYNDRDKGWILFSAGPDREYDLDPTVDYDALTSQPSLRLLLLSHDPTNGSNSSGDLWRVSQ